MFTSTAEMAPPNTLPVYTPSMNMIAVCWDMPTVRPMSSVMAMVVESPGMAPQSMPRVTPARHASQSHGSSAIRTS